MKDPDEAVEKLPGVREFGERLRGGQARGALGEEDGAGVGGAGKDPGRELEPHH